uniref:AlNc14C303G10412 protein n=1 Tax=Albugo laibachii Nc14 TaxID=890382 RepID=F0WVS5_9STRA|nr:AlNc14C303G10412 [Albugo laibachii Nc14]|eukprot:CCA25521.1 AlNc14C303G10412 [Albugo laibachii Nc14]
MVSAKNLVAGLFLLAGSNANNAIRFLEETYALSQASEMAKPAPMSPALIPSQNPPRSIPRQSPPPQGMTPTSPSVLPPQGMTPTSPSVLPAQGMTPTSPSTPGGPSPTPPAQGMTPGTPGVAQMVCPDFHLPINVFVGQLWSVCQKGDVVSCRGQFSTLVLIIQPLLSIDVGPDLHRGIFLYLALFPGSTASPKDVLALIELRLGEYETALGWYRYLTDDLPSLGVGINIGSLINVDIGLGLRINLGVALLMLFACH